MNPQPYPEYKDSGVPWLREVPEHWEVKRLGSQFAQRKEKVSDKDYPPLSVTKKGILPQLETAAKTNDGDNRKKVVAGDFVINSRSDRKGSSGISPHTGSVSLINTVITPLAMDQRYVHNFFRSFSFQEEFYRVGRGIVADLWSTKYSDMATIMVPVPPPTEQRQIARYLDWQTAKISTFIRNKKKLIALLKEQKQNIINEAVTKGINPHVKMKDSGVEWIGEIPTHWSVRKFKQLGAFICGYSFDSARFTDSGTRVLKIANIQTMNISWADESYLPLENFDLYKRFQVKTNDLVFALTRPVIKSGLKAAIVSLPNSERILLNQRNAIFRSNDLISKSFLYYTVFCPRFLDAFLLKIDFTGQQPNISTNDIGQIHMPIPSLSEQQTIVAHIEKETAIIDRTITRAEREIELIEEYRTRLVSDVVTGKVDVRSVEIPNFEPVAEDAGAVEDEEEEELLEEMDGE
ncbi:MAG: restriction endonuclease subunit S [Spartobacteria bacterium]|nr:restriction endonuclease subunit S [Spartobacteria bacterium]